MNQKLYHCKYDLFHECEYEKEVTPNYCLGCIYDMLLIEASTEKLALLGFHLKILQDVLKDLNFVMPEPMLRVQKSDMAR